MLSRPTLKGPLSVLSASFKVGGLVQGANVQVSSIGPKARVLATASSVPAGSLRLRLRPGEVLRSDDLVIVSQEMDGELSPPAPSELTLRVQPEPDVNSIEAIGMLTSLHHCGKYVWLRSAIPGAQAQVEFDGQIQAEGVANEGQARLRLDNPCPQSGVTLRQSVPAGQGPDSFPPTFPISDSAPPPELSRPLVHCQTSVKVGGVLGGADVTVSRTSGVSSTAGFDYSALHFQVPPLEEGDELLVQQDFPECDGHWGPSGPFVVDPLDSLPAPDLPSELCEGATSVRVAKLVGGGFISLRIGGEESLAGIDEGVEVQHVHVSPLPLGAEVVAVQVLCDFESPPSNTVIVGDSASQAPALIGPLYACATAVRGEQLQPGGLVQVVMSDGRSDPYPVTGWIEATSPEMWLPVAPRLQGGADVWLEQVACGDASRSNSETVTDTSADSPVVVWPLYSGLYEVTVEGTRQGAEVYILIASAGSQSFELRGRAFAEESMSTVQLDRKLSVGDEVRAQQWLCAEPTEVGPSLVVSLPRPQSTILTRPEDGARDVSINPTFSWIDPGAGTDAAASGFTLTVWNEESTLGPFFTTRTMLGPDPV